MLGEFKQSAPPAPFSPQQAPVALNRRSDARETERAPKARLVSGDDGAGEVVLQRLQDADAAETDAGDQHAIGLSRARGADFSVEQLDLLLKAQAPGIEFHWRQVAPAGPRVVAYEAGRAPAVLRVLILNLYQGDETVKKVHEFPSSTF